MGTKAGCTGWAENIPPGAGAGSKPSGKGCMEPERGPPGGPGREGCIMGAPDMLGPDMVGMDMEGRDMGGPDMGGPGISGMEDRDMGGRGMGEGPETDIRGLAMPPWDMETEDTGPDDLAT